jgi:hypothetical protein
MTIVKATPWYGGNKPLQFFHNPPLDIDGVTTAPVLWSTVGRGTKVVVVGKTAHTDQNEIWLKCQIEDSLGYIGTYWTTLKTKGYYILAGSQTLHTVRVLDQDLLLANDLETHVVIFKGKVRTEAMGNANSVGDAASCTVLHVTKVEGVGGETDEFVQISWPNEQGIPTLRYFDTKAPCPFDIKKIDYQDTMLFYQGSLSDVPVVDPNVTEEPTDPIGEPEDPIDDPIYPDTLEGRVEKMESIFITLASLLEDIRTF